MMYWASYQLILARKNRLAAILWWTEVLGHASVATLLLGWSSAYHLYILFSIPALLTSSPRKQANQGVFAVVVLFFVLHFASTLAGPLAPLPPVGAMIVSWLNYFIVFVVLYSMTAVYRETIRRAENKLVDTAMTDSLTGLSNRVHFNIRAATELARARRDSKPVCLLLVDIDHFKQINDHHGHEAGDTVLTQVAGKVRAGLREIDVLARWGGEEFLIMLPGSSLERSAGVAKRVCDAVAAHRFETGAAEISVTVSIGVAQLSSKEEMNAAVARADKALYASKEAGRNQVTVDAR